MQRGNKRSFIDLISVNDQSFRCEVSFTRTLNPSRYCSYLLCKALWVKGYTIQIKREKI